MNYLPSPADLADVNHPRSLLIRWRSEATRLGELVDEHARSAAPDVRAAVDQLARDRSLLARCADELERRLRWSGMLDP
jgi:hypothetical protein